MSKNYYETHREEVKARQKLYYETHKEQAKKYYQNNRERLINAGVDYYASHKEEITNHRRQHEIHEGNVTLKGNKVPYPADGICPVCHGAKKLMNYHHWNDTNLSDGLWLCASCHIKLEVKIRRYGKKLVQQMMDIQKTR